MSQLIRVSAATTSDRAADVVFVHGLQGDAVATWRSRQNDFWPRWLAEDLPAVGVWSLGYESSAIKYAPSMDIHDRALNAIAQCEANGLADAPVIFVCHSLGGLLVKQIIRHGVEYPNSFGRRLQEATKGIVFLATPHSGSTAATWADRVFGFLAGPLLKELRAGSAQLLDLNQWYRTNAGRLGIKHQAYSETRAVSGVFGGALIVDPSSADPGVPDLIPVPLDADHVSICKPDSRDSLLYRRVRAFVVHFGSSSSILNPTLPQEFGTQPAVSAVSAMPELNLRKLIATSFQRAEVAVLWFDTFGDGMDEHLPGKSLNECVIELLLRTKRRRKEKLLFEAIGLERPDLADDIARIPGA